MSLLQLSPLRMSSPPIVNKQRVLEDELLDRQRHFVEMTLFPREQRIQATGGMGVVRQLLDSRIGVSLHQPKLAACAIGARQLLLTGPAGCGLRTTLMSFCADQHTPVTVLKYCAFSAERETTLEFWHKMYDLADEYSPCILLVHRIQARMPPQVAATILSQMHGAWFRRNTSEHSQMGNVWTVFVDASPPTHLCQSWTFEALQTAAFCAPTALERESALRSAIYNRLCTCTTLDVCDKLIAAYEPYIKRCIEPVSDTEELELGGLAAVEMFVTLVFRASLSRQPELMRGAARMFADPETLLPIAEDFVTATKTAQKRAVQIGTITTGYGMPGKARTQPDATQRTRFSGDVAMYGDRPAFVQ